MELQTDNTYLRAKVIDLDHLIWFDFLNPTNQPNQLIKQIAEKERDDQDINNLYITTNSISSNANFW